MKFIIITVMLLSILATGRSADLIAPAAKFEQAYVRWKTEVATNTSLGLRSNNPQYSCDSFKNLVELGMEILPEVVAKLSGDPALAPAVYMISRKEFPREDARRLHTGDDVVRYYQTWWRTAEADTESMFTEEFGKWKSAKRQGMKSEEKVRIDRMKSLGRLALPRLFDKIASGETDLISVASELVAGAIPPTATVGQCGEWWAQNKTKWTARPALNQTTKDKP